MTQDVGRSGAEAPSGHSGFAPDPLRGSGHSASVPNAGPFLLFTSVYGGDQAIAILPSAVTSVRSAEADWRTGDRAYTVIFTGADPHHVEGYFRDVVDALASGIVAAEGGRDAKRLDERSEQSPVRDSADAQNPEVQP